jgi:hypothetical protein
MYEVKLYSLKQNGVYRFVILLYNVYSKYSICLMLMRLNICSGQEISTHMTRRGVDNVLCSKMLST